MKYKKFYFTNQTFFSWLRLFSDSESISWENNRLMTVIRGCILTCWAPSVTAVKPFFSTFSPSHAWCKSVRGTVGSFHCRTHEGAVLRCCFSTVASVKLLNTSSTSDTLRFNETDWRCRGPSWSDGCLYHGVHVTGKQSFPISNTDCCSLKILICETEEMQLLNSGQRCLFSLLAVYLQQGSWTLLIVAFFMKRFLGEQGIFNRLMIHFSSLKNPILTTGCI